MPRSVRRPKRSGTGRVSRPIPKKNMKMGPGIREGWRPDETALQNAKRLGLSIDANNRESLKRAHVLGKRAAAGDEVVLGSLEAARRDGTLVTHNTSWRPKCHMTEDQMAYMKKLQARHGDDFAAMSRDMKRNYLQKPEASLKRTAEKLIEFEAWLTDKAAAQEDSSVDNSEGLSLPSSSGSGAAASGGGSEPSTTESNQLKRARRTVKVEGAAEAGVPEEREFMGVSTERKLGRIAPAESSSARVLMKMAAQMERNTMPAGRDSATRGSKAPQKAARQEKIAEIRRQKQTEHEVLRARAEAERKAVRRRVKAGKKEAEQEAAGLSVAATDETESQSLI